MNRPKRHHWWPTCHSNLWVDSEGVVSAIDHEGRIVRTTPNNTAVIGHYNSVRLPDGKRDSSLEDFFANEIESPVAPVLTRLAKEKWHDTEWERIVESGSYLKNRKALAKDGFALEKSFSSATFPPADRRAIARYVASLLVRVPSYKDELNSQEMLNRVSSVLSLQGDEARSATDSIHIDIIRAHLDLYAGRLEDCAYILVDSTKHEYIIGDTPIIPAALGWGEAVAQFPISPERAMVIMRGFRSPFPDRILVFRALPATVRSCNKTMAQNSDRQIFCRTPVDAVFVRRNLGTRRVRIVPKIEEGRGTVLGGRLMLDRPPS